jgi:hypothetical protein
MANPTPRTDALRAMREAKFEAEQRRMKQEAGKPAAASTGAAVKPVAASDDTEPAMGEKAAAKAAIAKEAAVEEIVAKKATAKKTVAKKPAKAKVAKKAG